MTCGRPSNCRPNCTLHYTNVNLDLQPFELKIIGTPDNLALGNVSTNLAFSSLFVFELGARMRHTDGRTHKRTGKIRNVAY